MKMKPCCEKESKNYKEDCLNGIQKSIETNWPANLTTLNLSHQNIKNIDQNIRFPASILELNLSHNELKEVQQPILILEHLESLDISYNHIKYFDDIPSFTPSLKRVYLANNHLEGPPYWFWSETTTNLVHIDVSCNPQITSAFKEEYYYQELLQYTCPATEIKAFNCNLQQYTGLLQTFPKAKVLELGTDNYSYLSSNKLVQIPCEGLDKFCDIQRLNLSNTQIYTIGSNIDIYMSLVEINLSYNCITDVPKEFCKLVNLEVCVLSGNGILYLPDEIARMERLQSLHLDSNKLCMVPEDMGSLNLQLLDLYDNCLYEVPDDVKKIANLDLAQNYCNEPEDSEYLEKKTKIRLLKEGRFDGCKEEIDEYPFDKTSSDITEDDEDLSNYVNDLNVEEEQPESVRPPSSPEDWDSDEYWIPCYYRNPTTQSQSPWLQFISQKIENGNFCPIDMHPVSVSETVKYERKLNPKVFREAEGQFDDVESEVSDH